MGSKPSKVPLRSDLDDHIVPYHFWDNNVAFRSLVFDVTLRFNDAIDMSLIHGALERLLNKPGWRKLGARTRMRVSIDYYCPALLTNLEEWSSRTPRSKDLYERATWIPPNMQQTPGQNRGPSLGIETPKASTNR